MFKFEIKKVSITKVSDVQRELDKFYSKDGIPVTITSNWDKSLLVKIRDNEYTSAVDATIALASIFIAKSDRNYEKLQNLVENFLAVCLAIKHKKAANLKPRLSIQFADKGRFKFERFGITEGFYGTIKEMYIIFSSYRIFYKVSIVKGKHSIIISIIDGKDEKDILTIPYKSMPDYHIVTEIGVFGTLLRILFKTAYSFIENNESLIKGIKEYQEKSTN